MTNNSLVDIGKLSEPATLLVEKISDAIGGIAKPWQTRRVAQAESDAELIKAKTQIKISDLQNRAIDRFIAEETIKQRNIENITAKALPQISQEAKPEEMESDWIANFFDKSRLITDDEMQSLWASLLAGEANSPGTYSKRTINILHSINKSDALLFQSFCSFSWEIGPLIYDFQNDVYNKHNINFGTLMQLNEIGLISFEPISGYRKIGFLKESRISYFDNYIDLLFDKDENNEMKAGAVLYTKSGSELSGICNPQKDDDFFNYIIKQFKSFKNMRITHINGVSQTEE